MTLKAKLTIGRKQARIVRWALSAVLFSLPAGLFSQAEPSANDSPQVAIDFTRAVPRKVEGVTESNVTRDYRYAWTIAAKAMSSNSTEGLNAYFAGSAREGLGNRIASQVNSGIRSFYLNQNHKLEAVFYSPEGDVMELHDTAEFDLHVTVAGKDIHNEHVVLRYVVIMTPEADRWVVRELQPVPQF